MVKPLIHFPKKKAIGRFDEKFLVERREQLAAYMKQLWEVYSIRGVTPVSLFSRTTAYISSSTPIVAGRWEGTICGSPAV